MVEVSARAVEFDERSGYGFALKRENETALRCFVLPETLQIEVSEQDEYGQAVYHLPPDFEPRAFHLWRVEIDGATISIRLDEANFVLHKQLKFAPTNFALATQNCQAAFAGFALTSGFENDFDWQKYRVEPTFAAHNWTIENSAGNWKVADNLLTCVSQAGESRIVKNNLLTNFELVVNARLDAASAANGRYGFFLASAASEIVLTIETDNAKHFLNVLNGGAQSKFALPEDFALDRFEQFRVRAENNCLIVQRENRLLGEIEIERIERKVGLFVRDAAASFDMIRITANS